MDYTKLKVPPMVTAALEAHNEWKKLLSETKKIVDQDNDLQHKTAAGFRIKERQGPPEVIGVLYAQYCQLTNKMYDAYLNSIQLQKAPYILNLLKFLIKRLYELRAELVHIVVNDFIYVDGALTQLKLTPQDIEIVVPYHFPLESRSDTVESVLQKMWSDAIERKERALEKAEEVQEEQNMAEDLLGMPIFASWFKMEEESFQPSESTVSIKTEEYLNAVIIQKHERRRQTSVILYKAKCDRRKMIMYYTYKEPPKHLRDKASKIIQLVYREYMKIKRKRVIQLKKDLLLGILPERIRLSNTFKSENNVMYQKRFDKRQKILDTYKEDLEREKARIYLLKYNNQIDDITDHIIEWFREWYNGVGFFPEYPYDTQGGTILVIRGDYITVEEKNIANEKLSTSKKGKSSQDLKREKKQAADARKQEKAAELAIKRKENKQLFKLRCNPFTDPGYKPHEVDGKITDAISKYSSMWATYDNMPPEKNLNIVYGYIKSLLTEDLMVDLHKTCRLQVDENMRAELKLLVKVQKEMFKMMEWTYPKIKPKRKPKSKPVHKDMLLDESVQEKLNDIFDLEIVTKPTTVLDDIYGDLNYAAYEYNIEDPDATFPPPCYGDIRRRLILTCIHGMGIDEGSKKNKAVILVGPPCNGKSFMIDAVCGEINAVKIDISPEILGIPNTDVNKIINLAFLTAKALQPAVVFMKNLENVFCKKAVNNISGLDATVVKKALVKEVKSISNHDKIMLIATCSNPFQVKVKILKKIFNEILMVPILDYGTLRQYFYYKLQKIQSVPRDFCVQPIAKMLQGYGFGKVVRNFGKVMTPERIVQLNIKPLNPMEFIEPFLDELPVTPEEYKKYTNWYIKHSKLANERKKYELINTKRAIMYENMEKKKNKAKNAKVKGS